MQELERNWDIPQEIGRSTGLEELSAPSLPLKEGHRLGFIGVGSITRDHVRTATNRGTMGSDVFYPSAFADINETEVYRDLASSFPRSPLHLITTHNRSESLRDFFAAVDTVVINIPPGRGLRYEYARLAVAAGKHVILEKPPADSVRELDRLAEIAHEMGIVVYTAYHAAETPAVAELEHRLQHDQIEEINITYREFVFNWHRRDSWVVSRERGVVEDSGINAISVVDRISGRAPLTVDSARLSIPQGRSGEYGADICFSLPEGGRGRLTLDWEWTGPEQRDIVVKTRSGKHYLLNVVRSELMCGDELIYRPQGPIDQHGEQYTAVYRNFVCALEQGEVVIHRNPLKFVEDVYAVSKTSAAR